MYPMSVYAVRHILSAVLAVVFCCSAVDVGARILLVPNEYPEIKQAVNAAQSGDTVRVAQGEYFENFALGKGITLEGGWDKNFRERDFRKNTSTINGANGMGPVVFAADNAVIDGFTIKGGQPPRIMPDAALGPGVYCYGASSFVLRNNTIIGNNAAGIYSGFCSAFIVNNIIAGNRLAGIFLESSVLVVAANRIAYNQMAGIDVGIPQLAKKAEEQLSKVEISNNVVHNNKRAGLNVTWASGSVSNNLIYTNEQAGIRCGAGPMLLVNNTVTSNQLAGISVADSSVEDMSPAQQESNVTDQRVVPLIKNNIITHNGEAGIKSEGLGYSYNLLYGNNKVKGFYPEFLWYLRLQFGGYEERGTLEKTKNILADPLFVNPGKYDYHLKSDSPAIDAGDPDVRFNDRNFWPSLGSDVNDMGAYGGPGTIAEARPVNLRPEARITPLEKVYSGEKVILNGADSFDPNGDEIRYDWNLLRKPFGSMAVMMPGNDGTCAFPADKSGIYTVRMTITDRWGMKSVPRTMNVIAEANRPPSAKINKPTNPINVGDTVTLFAYDKKKQNGSELTYSWTLISAPTQSKAFVEDRKAARPSFRADVPGCYSVRLTVGNGKKNSVPDTLHVCTKQSRIPGTRKVPDEYPTIQVALDTAEAGDDIIVQPGRYEENIIIDKAVNLIGVGRPVIDGGGGKDNEAALFVCYLDNTASGRIQGFSVTGGGGGRRGHGIQVLNCSPEILNNHIQGNKHVGVGIHGMKKFTENIKIHDNLIYNNAIGISNGLGAGGQIYNNTIYDNEVSGIGVRGLAEPVIRNNIIHDNYIGIGVREEAYPALENNRIYENAVGIAINPGVYGAVYVKKSTINIQKNMVYNNRQCGMFVSSLNKSGLSIRSNTVRGNSVNRSSASRSGGVVTGEHYETLVGAFMAGNSITDNGGRDIQQYKDLAASAGDLGSSELRRPKFGRAGR
ncbi:MAG: hypothetical protein D3924_05120 [Candidatus Electrothrix sp. AR4]|nr:hypothetical protein [Candidatus Electrothrix sp. AR4]